MDNIQFQRSAIDASSAFSSAWEQVKSNYGTYLGVSLVAMIMLGCLSCISWFLMGPVMGGIFYLATKGQRGEPVEFGMMFEGFKKFVPLMVIGLIQAVPGIVVTVVQTGLNFGRLGVMLSNPEAMRQAQRTGELDGVGAAFSVAFLMLYIGFMVFSLVWWAVTYFAIPLVMEYDLGPVDAIKLSGRAAFANIGGLIAVILFGLLATIIGLLLLCVGVFLVSMPIILVANVIVFWQVFPRQDRGNQYFTPPPPGTYGFGSPQY
ncbi:MAG TPA: hypothetical protein PLR83_03280 [Pyrinomonadaceae bacterium]|nr:hypothetical protein [Pyrinomonadaceae bacterium]